MILYRHIFCYARFGIFNVHSGILLFRRTGKRSGLMRDETIYKMIGGSDRDGLLACGFMAKTPAKSQMNFCIPYYSVFLLLEGHGQYTDENGAVFDLTPGCIVQRLPYTVHSTRVLEGAMWQEFFISFGKSTFDSLVSLNLLDPLRPVSRTAIYPAMLMDFEKLMDSFKTQSNTENYLQAQSVVLSLFRSQEPDAGLMEKAKEILSSHLAQPLTESGAAARLGIGTESFRKLFKKQMGISPMSYRMEQKMATAKMMLLSGASIKETAVSLGYSDSYAFSKAFKKKVGVSPSRCRF